MPIKPQTLITMKSPAIKDSFIANDTLITHNEPVNTDSTLTILIISAVLVIAAGVIVILIFTRKPHN